MYKYFFIISFELKGSYAMNVVKGDKSWNSEFIFSPLKIDDTIVFRFSPNTYVLIITEEPQRPN